MGFFHYFFTHQKVSIMTRSIFHNNNSGQQCKENTGGQRRSTAGSIPGSRGILSVRRVDTGMKRRI